MSTVYSAVVQHSPRTRASSLRRSTMHVEKQPPPPVNYAQLTEQLVAAFHQLIRTPSPQHIPGLLRRLGFSLLPSFVQSRIRGGLHRHGGDLHPTAYLDGLRGLAAFCVFISHLVNTCHDVTHGYGYGESGENQHLLQLPIIRLFYSGPPMVAIFFVISGYALSYKPVRQMRSHDYEGLMNTMASSVFRRTMRLYLPCFASTFLVFILLRLGVYEYTREMASDEDLLTDVRTEHPFRHVHLSDQIFDYRMKLWDFVHFWTWGLYDGTISYDWHLWTIPTEFRASMILFLTHVGIARMLPTLRVFALAGLIYWVMTWDRWEMILFYSGALIAELNMMFPVRRSSPAASNTTTTPSNNPPTTLNTNHKDPPAYVTHGEAITLGLRDLPMHRSNSPPRTPMLGGVLPQLTGRDAFWACNFILALFIVSSPDAAFAETPGYRWLSTFIPAHYSQKYRFLQSVGAIYLVFSISNNLHLQSLFTQPAIHYLGKISFALYLMHGMVTQTLGFAALAFFWDVTGVEPRWRKEVGFGLATALTIPATIWAADVFWRHVDVPSVRCARWVEQICTVQDVHGHAHAHVQPTTHQRQLSQNKHLPQQMQMHDARSVAASQPMETVSLNLK